MPLTAFYCCLFLKAISSVILRGMKIAALCCNVPGLSESLGIKESFDIFTEFSFHSMAGCCDLVQVSICPISNLCLQFALYF